MNAILGWSESCIAVHPSDMCVALAALEPTIHVTGPKGDRAIPFTDFHRLPGDTPETDTNLAHDEIVIAIELPPEGFLATIAISRSGTGYPMHSPWSQLPPVSRSRQER